MEVMMFQICRTDSVPNFEIPFQNSKKNDHFNVIVLYNYKVYYEEEGGASSPKFWPW